MLLTIHGHNFQMNFLPVSLVAQLWSSVRLMGCARTSQVISNLKSQVYIQEGLLIICCQCKSLNLGNNSLCFSKVVDKKESNGTREKGTTSWHAVSPSMPAVGNPSHSSAHGSVCVSCRQHGVYPPCLDRGLCTVLDVEFQRQLNIIPDPEALFATHRRAYNTIRSPSSLRSMSLALKELQ